jgi:glycosyltransferase involved in cell wall biosynthesis
VPRETAAVPPPHSAIYPIDRGGRIWRNERAMFLSVLLPAFNAEKHLAEALASVLAQTHAAFELLVLNDGSSDRTLEIAERFRARDSRIRVITHGNMGMGAALNQGLQFAAADWIARLDADDIMLPNRLERQIAFVQSQPRLAVAASLVYYIGEDGRLLGAASSPLATPQDFARRQREGKPISLHHPSVMFRKDVVVAAGGYRPAFWPADDFDLWARLAEQGHLILVQQEYLAKYRIHGASISIAGAAKAGRHLRWAKECAARRRHGRSEPTYAQFQEIERSRPLAARANHHRKDLAKVLFKEALYDYSVRRYLRAAAVMCGACLLRPGFAVPRLWTRFLTPYWRAKVRIATSGAGLRPAPHGSALR